MEGVEVLYWALSVLFCLALVFAILFWVRSWRNEDRENNLRHLQLLAREIKRLSEAVEGLESTATSLQTADEQLAQQIENMRDMGRDLKRQLTSTLSAVPRPSAVETAPAKPARAPEPKTEQVIALQEDAEDRYAQARDLLLAGEEQTAVARQLDLGTAEVRMIARLLEKTGDT